MPSRRTASQHETAAHGDRAIARPLVGLAAGLIGGLIAAAVMNGAQRLADDASDHDGQDKEPSTVKTADAVSKTVTGGRVPDEQREAAGNAVHYLTGAMIGGAYGVLAEYRPATTAGFGTAYGSAVALLLDEALVPAAGLGDPPWATAPTTHAYGIAGHWVFGITLEGIRRLLGGRTLLKSEG